MWTSKCNPTCGYCKEKTTHTCGCWTSLFSDHRIIHFLEATLVDCLWTHNVFVRSHRLRVKKNHYSTLSSTWDAVTMAKGVSTLQNQLDLCIKRGQWICFAFEMNVLKVLLPYPPPSIDSSYVNVFYHYSFLPLLLSDSIWKTCSECNMALNPIIRHTPPTQLKEL